MKINTKIAIATVAVGVIGAFVALVITQPPASWEHTTNAFYFSLMTNTLTFNLHLGAAFLFILSLSVYKQKMRTAFLGLVLGIVLIALGTFQLPVLDALDAWNSIYVTGGIVGLPFLLGGLVMYLGVSTFGRLVGERGLLSNKLVAIPISVVIAGTSMLLPHVETTVDEASFDISNLVLALTMVLLVVSAIIVLGTSQKIGTHYKYALRWTGIAILASSACLAIAITDTLISTATRDALTEFLNILTIVAGFAWLKAGHLFMKTKEF
jgi:hypothetical protein